MTDLEKSLTGSIPVNDFVLRQAISDFKEFLRLPNNRAATFKAKQSLTNLEAHLPENIAAAKAAAENA